MDERLQRHLDEVLNRCIHCGMCLPVCPTYALTGSEESSPRGRIRLVRSVAEGALDMSDRFVDEMYFCLDCQACQTACPAGVRYGEIVEDARVRIAEERREPLRSRLLKRALLSVLASPSRLNLAARLLRLYAASGLRNAVGESKILTVISEGLHASHALLPSVEEPSFNESVPRFMPAVAPRRGCVGLLTGCIMDVAFPRIHHDLAEVLRINGYDVLLPASQGCCGSLHAHNGEAGEAERLARGVVDAFAALPIDAIVVDSAGCGAFMKEYGRVLADDPAYADRARAVSDKTCDATEFLAKAGFRKPDHAVGKRITYHEACHLVHTQKISASPREIIRSVPGVEFVELPESSWCCGSAGIYNVLRHDDSMAFLDRKMRNIASTGADIVVTANPGCHLQLQYGAMRSGLAVEIMHPVSLLRRAYGEMPDLNMSKDSR